ncbi:hypothetical protein [Halomonas sp. E19]|uniref:hypothetical protein n=1 Tax=Halomonas sp. E19 TaxID=3397247 RepID=UPI004033C859
MGHAGPIIIGTAEREPFRLDHELVVLLTVWTYEDPAMVFTQPEDCRGLLHLQKHTITDFLADMS